MSSLKLYLLGPPQVEVNSGPIIIKRRKALSLLIYLAMTGEPQRRDTLAALFWPDSSQSNARAALRRDLSILNKALDGDWLLVERETIGLRTGSHFWLDIEKFKQQVADCPDITPVCIDALTEAVNLYRDDFLTGFTLPDCPDFDEWQFFQTEGLRQELASALERLVGAYRIQNNFEAAIPYARRRLALDPLHEPAHQELMRLYALDGQQGAALRQYEECVRILEEELGVSASAEITRLYEAIKTKQAITPQTDEELRAHPDHKPFPPTAPRHNLPAQTTTFIGRKVELAEVRERMTHPEVRLLTLTGPGGTGKTRLGLEVVADLLDLFADGIYFVDLAPNRNPALVDLSIADTLSIRPTGKRPVVERLIEYLKDKQILLLLDNFEHVIPATSMVTDLLAAAPKLKVLVTSRTLLRLSGEWDYPVPPLTLPDPERLPALEQLKAYEAVHLFGERAKAVKPTFDLTADNAPVVAQICVILDGLPLAIELAAARIRLLPPRKILAQLSSRLQFLTGGPRDLPARQQTLRDMIDWSYNLLEAEEQTLFQRLSVFAGGCTLDAAEEVGNVSGKMDALNVLESLIDKNLLKQTVVGDEPRFNMLETIREYALERLVESSEADTLRRSHAHYFLVLAEEAEPHMYGAEQVAWVKRLETEHDNLRSALQWSLDNAVEIGLRMAGALGRFWHMHAHHSEGRRWLTKALSRAEDHDVDLGQYRAKALDQAGMLSYFIGEMEQARFFLEDSVSLWRKVGDKRGLADALCDLGIAVQRQGDPVRARNLLEESIELLRQIEDEKSLVRVILWYGILFYWQGDYEKARLNLEECSSLGQIVGDLANIAAAKNILGLIALRQGDYVVAQSLFKESLLLFEKVEDKPGVAITLDLMGNLAYIQGNTEKARLYFEESLLIWQELGNKPDAGWLLYLLGNIALQQDDPQQAAVHFKQGLVQSVASEGKPDLVYSLAGLIAVAEAQGELERAARLLGISEVPHKTGDESPKYVDSDKYRESVAFFREENKFTMTVVRTMLGDEAFEVAYAEGRSMSLEQAISYALSG